MTDDKKFLIAAALLQIFLLGVLVTTLHTHLTLESLVGALLLLGAEFVVYREIRGMREPVPQKQPLRKVDDLRYRRERL
jgi:hypothetical protein